MAIYHCSIKVICRGKSQSAVAAAYRASGESQKLTTCKIQFALPVEFSYMQNVSPVREYVKENFSLYFNFDDR